MPEGATLTVIKIKEIRADPEVTRAESLEGQVLLQGSVHKQIFFVASDDRVYAHSEEVPFSQTVPVPGSLPGLPAGGSARVEHIGARIAGPRSVEQAVLLDLTATVSVDGELTGSRQVQLESIAEVLPPDPIATATVPASGPPAETEPSREPTPAADPVSEALAAPYDQRLLQLRKDFDRRLAALTRRHEAQIQELQRELVQARAEVETRSHKDRLLRAARQQRYGFSLAQYRFGRN